MSIRVVDDYTSIEGSTIASLTQGKAQFNDLVFKAEPSSQGVPFEITISSINSEVVNTATGDHTKTPNTKRIELSFRSCRAGEILSQGICEVCSYGFYTLMENQTQCLSCFNHATCEGGDLVNVNKGYWRSSNFTSTIKKCLHEGACP